METAFVIQDVKSKEYYWRYRVDDGFDSDLLEATKFDSEDEAIERLEEEFMIELFEGRVLEIKKFLFFEEDYY